MWEEYGDRSADAVAIETTVYDLRQALGSGFLFVPVRYIDRRQTRLPDSHSLEPFFFKGLRFAWERELRVVCDLQPGSRLETPRRVLVNPQQLRMRFVLAPGASSSRAAEVRGLLSTVTSDSQVCLSRLVS